MEGRLIHTVCSVQSTAQLSDVIKEALLSRSQRRKGQNLHKKIKIVKGT